MNAVVKGVLSGDTVILMGADASKGPPPEKMITLSSINAPRLGNRNGTVDAPFAWAAREFLRNQVIGRRVTFRIESQSGSNREFGTVLMEDGTSLASLMVAAGWAKVKPLQATEPHSPEYEELLSLGRTAEEQQLGLWTAAAGASAASVREVFWAGSFDTAQLLQDLKSAPQDALVEQVPSGSMLRVLLLPSFHQITLMLSGVQCGAIRRNEDGTEEAAPFAREARYFVESRLLHREVQVKLEGLDKNGCVLGSVLHPQGNMSLELVKVGLARVVDWSSQMCDNAPALRAAERAAKEKRLRFWRDYVPPNHGNDMTEFQGRVVEVMSGDTLIVADQTGTQRRVSLSSLRCPRMGKEPEAYAAEAKELLRKTLIGKKVKVEPEYKRTFAVEGAAAATERVFVTVLYNSDKNAAETMLAEGLATVSKHGQADERSLRYETLLEVEELAIANKKNLHSQSAPPRSAVIDLTLPTARERAKRYLNTLQRHTRVRAVVQFVANGARFKLMVPKENCLISFATVGIRCPQCSRRDTGTEGEPFGDEAHGFTRGLCMQRDVEIEVETIDKGGTFLGTLFLPDKRNLGEVLLEEGLASLVGFSAQHSTYGEELFAAEEAAKLKSLKLWENYSAKAEAEAKAASAAAANAELEPTPDAQKQVVELELTEIVDGAHFFAHVAGDTAVTALEEQLAAMPASLDGATFEPKVGMICCACFSADNAWYRARVLSKTKDTFTVFFLDYGNQDVVSRDRLKAIPASMSAQAISPQALECRLAYLIVGSPDDDGDGTDAALAFSRAAWGKRMLAKVEDRQAGVLFVTLFDPSQTNINELLLSEGLARVDKAAPKRAALVLKSMTAKEAAAKSSRKGMWCHGDVEEDDDFEFGMRRRPAAAVPEAKSNPWKK